MSLFKAREWWTTWCGGSDEEFDIGSLCLGNVDNSSTELDKIVVGSLNGVLRIFIAQKENFKPNDLMLEIQMTQPILQINTGKFVSGTDNEHLCVLHPRSLSVYSVTAVSGSVEHGNHFTLTKMYEHKLERTAACLTYGSFGGVKNKDFISVLSMDGVLTFYEQESFALQVYLPEFLLPGPFIYLSATDSFIVSTAKRDLEAYRYQTLASAAIGDNKKEKKILPDWCKCLGEHVLDMRTVNSSPPVIIVLGERSLFKISTDGKILTMKKLEYHASCLYPYMQPGKSNGSCVSLVGSHNSSLQIYNEIELVWAAQLPHVPIACRVGKFEGLSGVIVTLDEFGHLYTSYLGTDPSLFVTPQVEARQGNIEELDKELRFLNSVIKKAEKGTVDKLAGDHVEKLLLYVNVPECVDDVSQCPENSDEGITFPSITVQITIECKSIKPIENVIISCSAKYPIVCSTPQIEVPVIGTKGPETYEVSFYTLGGSLPSDLIGSIIVTYTDEKVSKPLDTPHLLQKSFKLPLTLIAQGSAPVKQSQYKLTLDSNKDQVNLAELFSDITGDSIIPTPVIGMQYFDGPVVTILTSKQSNRYRVQCDNFPAMYLIIIELVTRLENYFKEHSDSVPFKIGFTGPVPLSEYYESIDAHFDQRVLLNSYKELLNQRASQFRVIQKRLLTRFKDKTPSPLNHLDTILDGTYKQILALGDEFATAQMNLKATGNALSSATKLLNYLLGLFSDLSAESRAVLNSCLTPVVSDSHVMGWEESVTNNITLLLYTCLAKSTKDYHSMPVPITEIEKDTNKLKRCIALMVERMIKNGTLMLNKPGARRNQSDEEMDNALQKRILTNDKKSKHVILNAVKNVQP